MEDTTNNGPLKWDDVFKKPLSGEQRLDLEGENDPGAPSWVDLFHRKSEKQPLGLIKDWAAHKKMEEARREERIREIRLKAQAAQAAQHAAPQPSTGARAVANVPRRRGRPPKAITGTAAVFSATPTAISPSLGKVIQQSQKILLSDSTCFKCGGSIEMARYEANKWTCARCG